MERKISIAGFLVFTMLFATVPVAAIVLVPQTGEWSGFQLVGDSQDTGSPLYAYAAPAVVSRLPGYLDVFSLDTTNWGSTGSQLKKRSYMGSAGWYGTGFEVRGGNLTTGTNPLGAATNDAGNRIDLWAAGSSSELYQTSWQNPTWATSWLLPAGQHFRLYGSTGPSVVWHGVNEYVVWVNSTDQHLIVWKWTGTGPLTGWELPVDTGTPSGLTLTSSPSAIYDPTTDSIWIFVRASDNKLWLCHGGVSWAWESIAGGSDLGGAPAAVSRHGMVDVVYRTSEGEFVTRHLMEHLTNSWSEESMISGYSSSLNSDPAIVAWDDHRLDVFAQGPDGRIYQTSWETQSCYFGVFRPSTRQFILNTDPVTRITYGLSTDTPITGDWNGDGKSEIGVFRSGQFILDQDNDGVADTRVNFGMTGDRPVTGDWDNDTFYEIGVYRTVLGSQGQFILDNTTYNTPGTWTGTVSSRINFGMSTDVPIPIDWNRDGTTEIGVFRPSTREFIIRTDPVKRIGPYGLSTDTPLRTWWTYTGAPMIGVYRLTSGQGQFIFAMRPPFRYNFGMTGDLPITGKWI